MRLEVEELSALQNTLTSLDPSDPLYSALKKLLTDIPAPSGKEVEFSAKVPEHEYERFRTLFPQYGSVKWFIRTALSNFNQEVQRNPSYREQIDAAISNMMSGEVTA